MPLNVPFYSNPDDTHCFQACLRSVLKHFRPEREYSWAELDALSGKRPGKWTWPLYAIGQLSTFGFDAELIEDFDYSRFVATPEKYLIERFGTDAGNEQIRNSDIPYEVDVARKYSSLVGKPRIPRVEDIEAFLRKGFVPICCLNLPALYGQPGYLGHFVLPLEIKANSVVFHDPGGSSELFPGRENSEVSRHAFEASWVTDRVLIGLKSE